MKCPGVCQHLSVLKTTDETKNKVANEKFWIDTKTFEEMFFEADLDHDYYF